MERLRVVPIDCSVTGMKTGDYRIFKGDKAIGDVTTKRLADLLASLPLASNGRDEELLSAMEETVALFEALEWSSFTERGWERVRKLKDAIRSLKHQPGNGSEQETEHDS